MRDMHNEIIRRAKEKLTVREKKIRQAIKGGADVTAALECPDKLCESIMKILNNDIVDHYIIHRWLLLFAMTRSDVKSIKVSLVEVAKRTN